MAQVKAARYFTLKYADAYAISDADAIGDEPIYLQDYAETRIECIDAIAAMVEQWPGEPAYFAGNVVKYVWRHRQKAPVESLKKARWYLDRAIANVEKGKAP